MIVILATLKDQPLNRWTSSLTIITVLSKIASAALILPISEAIGQLKWSWFQGKKSKDAVDFEIFDKASRGAWGSFLLLYRTKGRSLAALGASLTVLLLAMDSFFQQVTNLPERYTFYGAGYLPRVIQYKPEFVKELENGEKIMIADQSMMQVADAFFTSNGTQPVALGNGTRPEIPLSCPTINCIWPAYETLAICSQCTEAPQLISYACLDTRVDWTSELNSTESSYLNGTVCGYFLNATSNDPVLMSGYILGKDGNPEGEALLMRTVPLVTNPTRDALWGGSINFRNVRNPIMDALISSTVDITQVHANVAPTIHECVIEWCVKTIESSSYWAGTYSENVTKIFVNRTAAGSPWSTFRGVDGTYTNYTENVTISAPSTGPNFPSLGWGVSDDTMINTVMVFDRLFPAFTTISLKSTESLLRWRTGHPTLVRTKVPSMNPWLLPNNITNHVERLAAALSNVIRSRSTNDESVIGTALTIETYILVHWAWLTFPLAMLCLSLMFLVATMFKTSKGVGEDMNIWKTSAMPMLISSLPQEARPDLSSSATSESDIKSGAEGVKIRLVPGQGWRVSEQIDPSPTVLRRSNPGPQPEWL
jgi:hypothetical protein